MIELKNIEDKLKKEDFIISDIKGNSMSPFLKEKRDRVVITKLVKEPQLYDVVLYKNNNKYILHRIIGISDDKYLIRGDNCISIEYIDKNRIIGILNAYYNNDDYIEVSEDINKNYFNKSNNSLLYRRIKAKAFSILRMNK